MARITVGNSWPIPDVACLQVCQSIARGEQFQIVGQADEWSSEHEVPELLEPVVFGRPAVVLCANRGVESTPTLSLGYGEGTLEEGRRLEEPLAEILSGSLHMLKG